MLRKARLCWLLPLVLAGACSSNSESSSDAPEQLTPKPSQSEGDGLDPGDSTSPSESTPQTTDTEGTPDDGPSLPDGGEGTLDGPPSSGTTPEAGAPNMGGPSALEGLTPQQKERYEQLSATLSEARKLDADALLQERALQQLSALPFDPLESEFLDSIQASALGLNESELGKLGSNGFVISARSAFPTFINGYSAIYSEHLPVYISADAILDAVHRSYDTILMNVEGAVLIPRLDELLQSMHSRLPSSDFDEQTRADVDLYLSVARSLLAGSSVAPVAGASASAVDALVQLANAASGEQSIELFGVERTIDASQFAPRGHYTDERAFQAYFRAMMWLGRIDLRLIETLPNGATVFNRPQFDGMLLLDSLLSDADLERWNTIDSAVRAFVGESDSMVVPEVAELVADLGGAEAAREANDEVVRNAIEVGGYGLQDIATDIMVNDGSVETLPLNRSFLLFGQRYVLDSHVFSQVVYDRVDLRMMPSPLDAAYAALGNDGALPLLASELQSYAKYPGNLEAVRELADAHGETFWESNLYNLWLGSLRALSPAKDLSDPTSMGLPSVAGTEAWNRRILGTQLASWAELRHDTLLYAKQSYTDAPACDYPDAYVDPYPEFFGRLKRFAERGSELVNVLSGGVSENTAAIANYFATLGSTMTTLEGMAQNQRDGVVFSEAQLAFVNRAVRILDESVGCTTVQVPDGWLADLYFNRDQSIEADPTIADVHTQPADEAGNTVGKVLHVGTGFPRLMVVTADTCMGPRAYAGVSFAYHERITENFERLTDQSWSAEVSAGTPEDPVWLQSVVAQ